MKKLFINAVLALVAVFGYGQTQHTIPTKDYNDTRYLISAPVHVAQLPAAASVPGQTRVVDDAQSVSDCTVGSGSSRAVCVSNGVTWFTFMIKGDPGIQGPTGATGATGSQGPVGFLDAASAYTSSSAANAVATASNVQNVAPRSLKEFGAKGDGIFSDFKMTAGSNVVTLVDYCCGYYFQPGDVGKLISLPKVDADGKTLYTTIAAYTDNSHVTVATAATNSFDGTGSFLNQAIWMSDDSAAFGSAVAWAQNGRSAGQGATREAGGSLYIPCGYYGVGSQITIAVGISVEGASQGCSQIFYMGTSAIDATVSVLPGGTTNVLRGNYYLRAANHPEVGTCSGSACSPSFNGYISGRMKGLTIFGNKYSKYALSVLMPTDYHGEDLHVYGGSAGAFYTMNGVQNTWVHLFTGTDRTFGNGPCVNGLYFDGSGIGQGMIPTVITSPNVQGCTGTAMVFNYVSAGMVEGAQVSVSNQSLKLSTSGNIVFAHDLFEAGSTPDDISGNDNLFLDDVLTDSGVNVSGPNNTFLRGQFGPHQTLNISGANNVFDNVSMTIDASDVTVVDTAKTTVWRSAANDGGAGTPQPGFPVDQSSTPPVSNWTEPVVSVRGAWTVGSATPVQIPTTQLTSGEAWRAVFIGDWIDAGTGVAPAQYVELTDSSNTITVSGSDTLTFTINASGYFQMATNGTSVGFSGQIILLPKKGHTSGDSGTVSMQLAGTLKANAIQNAAGNTLLASTLTGLHGTSGTKVQYSDGTGTSGNLAKFAADGSVTDGPTPPAGTIVGTTDTQTLTNKTVDSVTPTTFGFLDPTSSVQTQLNGKVSTATTVNGHALSANVTVTASDVGLGSVTNDAQTKNSIVPNSFAGIRFGNSGAVDTAATGAQVASALGSTAVTNATNATNATNVSNTGGVTTNATYYLCLLAANTTSNQPCNTPTNLLVNPSLPSITTPSTVGFRIWAGSSNNLLLGAGSDALSINSLSNVVVNNGGSVYPNATSNAGSFGAAGHDWLAIYSQAIPQINDIASIYYVTANFTTAANTSLQTITGLSWTLIASTAQKVPFSCHLAYSQATATAAVAFGIQAATIAPNQIFATGEEWTSSTAVTTGVLANLTTTTATNIVSATPAAISTNNVVNLSGEIDNPSNASSNAINIMVSTATAADAVTILKGSYCRIN